MMLHENMFYVKQTKKLTLHEKLFHGGKNKMRLHKKKKYFVLKLVIIFFGYGAPYLLTTCYWASFNETATQDISYAFSK